MQVKISKVIFVVLAIAIVFYVFEQALLLIFGFDSVLKPYRIVVIFGIILLLLFPARIAGRVKVISLSLFGLYIFGGFIALIYVVVGFGGFERLVNQFLLFLVAYFIYVLVVYNINYVNDLEKIFFVILMSVIASPVFYFISNDVIGGYRAAGFFNNPNHFGYSIGVGILIMIFYLHKYVEKFFFIFLMVVISVVLLFLLYQSGSRSTILSLAIALLILLYRYVKIYKRKSVRMLFIVAFVAVLVYGLQVYNSEYIINDKVFDRYRFANMAEASGRFDLMKSGFIAAIDYIGLGMGMGQYMENHQNYINQVAGYVYKTVLEYDLGLHNEYLVLLVEFGFMPLVLYVYILYVIWRHIKKVYGSMPHYSIYAIIIESLFVFDIVFSLSQQMYGFPFHWIVLGLSVSLIKLNESAYKEADNMIRKELN